LSNLLPEGALRAWIAQSLKVHEDNEFPLFAWLGQDLPGALIATALIPEQVPEQCGIEKGKQEGKFETTRNSLNDGPLVLA